MNKPALYHKSHRTLKQNVGQIIKEYSTKFQWLPQGGDTLIDVGSGPGDVSMNYIYPMLPANYGKIVFSDILVDMLKFLKANYKIPEKCEFKVLDIATKSGLPCQLEGQFDHVTSILVLHWVPDNRTALKNMFQLLRPEGGDCLMIFFSYNNIFDANNCISHYPKWSPLIKDVDRFISPLNYSKDPKKEFEIMMLEAGFCNISVELKSASYSYETEENFIENIIPVCGVLDFIPESRQSEFFNDYVDILAQSAAQRYGYDVENSKHVLAADLVVAYGQKPATTIDSKIN